MDCIGVRENINAYIDGELSEVEAKLVESHLSECSSCRHERDAYELTRSFVASAGPAPSPAGLSESIRVMMEKERLIPKQKTFHISRSTGTLLAASFAVALMAGAVSLKIISFDHEPVTVNNKVVPMAAVNPKATTGNAEELKTVAKAKTGAADAKVIISPASDAYEPAESMRMKRSPAAAPASRPADTDARDRNERRAAEQPAAKPAAKPADATAAKPGRAAAPHSVIAPSVSVPPAATASRNESAPATPMPPAAKPAGGSSPAYAKLPAALPAPGYSDMIDYARFRGMDKALAATSNTGLATENFFHASRGSGGGVETVSVSSALTAGNYTPVPPKDALSFTYFPEKDKKEAVKTKSDKQAKPPLKMTVKVKSKDPAEARAAALKKLPAGTATVKDGKIVLKQPADDTLASLKNIKSGTAGQAKMTVPEAMLANEARDPQPRTVETEVIFVADEE